MNDNSGEKGLTYAPGVVGKHVFRIREIHVRDRLAPLIRSKRHGAVKLDLILRGLALLPGKTGRRLVPGPGLVLPDVSYEQLHDLARGPGWFGPDEEDPDIRSAKQKWVGEQLSVLEEFGLVKRLERRGKRPHIVVLRDDATGQSFDDPDGTSGNSYVTIPGNVIATGQLAQWKAPEVCFFLAAMIAEGYERQRRRRLKHPDESPPGGGQWFRPLTWFNDASRPTSHVLIPFRQRTLERGLKAFIGADLVTKTSIKADPVTRRRFGNRRNLYTNHFVDGLTDADLAALLEDSTPQPSVPVSQTTAPSEDTVLRLVETGRALLDVLHGAGGHAFEEPEHGDSKEVALVGEFLQELHDLMIVLNGMEPMHRVEWNFRMSQRLAELRATGFDVYAAAILDPKTALGSVGMPVAIVNVTRRLPSSGNTLAGPVRRPQRS